METELYDEFGRKTAPFSLHCCPEPQVSRVSTPVMSIPTVFGEPLLDAAYEIGRLRAELAEANKQVVTVHDMDGITFDGYQIRVHETSLASQIKARVRFDSHHLIQMLIRELLSQTMELDPDKPQEWGAMDMTWVL